VNVRSRQKYVAINARALKLAPIARQIQERFSHTFDAVFWACEPRMRA
jgi:hypothetical protein